VKLIGTAAVPLPILHDQKCCEFAASYEAVAFRVEHHPSGAKARHLFGCIGTAEAVPLPSLYDQKWCEFAMSARIFSNMLKPCPFPIFATALAAETIPQGLKPAFFSPVSARLKPCPYRSCMTRSGASLR
jgi:hypothetical protein